MANDRPSPRRTSWFILGIVAALTVQAGIGVVMFGDRERIMAAGAQGYLEKPIDPERFAAEVERSLPPLEPVAMGHTP